MAYAQQKKKETTIADVENKYIKVQKDKTDEFIDWIQNADLKDIEAAINEDTGWMESSKRKNDRIEDIVTIKEGSPLGLTGDEKILEVKFTWGQITYRIKWTQEVDRQVTAWTRDRKIDELLKDEESFIDRCLNNDCIDDDI